MFDPRIPRIFNRGSRSKALDDDLALAGAKFDIIDTRELVTISVQETEEFLLNALFD